ncbi:MAG TPA: formyltransferase family protein [Candidatus Cloacimonadota bacterium]|nr:formyltransferase family protein [Candidatus Cloacimonadota bacterium]
MAGTPSQIFRIITLSSGHSRGSNLLAMHRHFHEQQLPVEIFRAVFTKATAPAIEHCTERGIPVEVISAKDMPGFEARLLSLVRDNSIDLIALCGFLKLLSADFLDTLGIPVLNIHPALLPNYGGKSMYGMAVHEAVYSNGEQYSGATVHRADAQYDHGAIVAQQRVDISSCLSAAEVAARVLQVEHQLYAQAIWGLLSGIS